MPVASVRSMKNWLIVGGLMCVLLAGADPAQAQVRDNVWNGALIGAAVGAGTGIALTYATRDSELSAEQYAYGALIFGGIGAGVGMGIDVLLFRNSPRPPQKPQRVIVAPVVWRSTKAVAVKWRW